jgi:hypothetical protein
MDEKAGVSLWRILPAMIVMVGALWIVVSDPWSSEAKPEVRPLDGVWRFSRLMAPDVKAILDGWRGASLVIRKNKANVQIGVEKTEYDVSTVVVKENRFLVLHDEYGEVVRFLYELNGDTLTLCYLPHATPRKMGEGIVVEFKRRR